MVSVSSGNCFGIGSRDKHFVCHSAPFVNWLHPEPVSRFRLGTERPARSWAWMRWMTGRESETPPPWVLTVSRRSLASASKREEPWPSDANRCSTNAGRQSHPPICFPCALCNMPPMLSCPPSNAKRQSNRCHSNQRPSYFHSFCQVARPPRFPWFERSAPAESDRTRDAGR